MGYVPKDPKRAKRLREKEDQIRAARGKSTSHPADATCYKNGCREKACRLAYYEKRGMNVKNPNSKPRGKK
jgi:hypothetical protein